jgi:Protein of unknown function (DUF551)
MTGWRAIETAPRDGEDALLLWKPDQPRTGASMFAAYWSDDPIVGIGWVPLHGVYTVAGVTHWMPLPEPPK